MAKKHQIHKSNQPQATKKIGPKLTTLEAVQRHRKEKIAAQFESRLDERKKALLTSLDPAILQTMTEADFDHQLRHHEESSVLQDHAAYAKELSDKLEATTPEELEKQLNLSRHTGSRKAFASHLNKAIQEADVVIEVLDARDPQAYRSEGVERQCISAGKKVILVINKVDLVPDIKVVEQWETHLRKFHPTVCFRSMTTGSRSKHATVKFSNSKATRAPHNLLKSGYEPLGVVELMNLLKNYSRTTLEQREAEARMAEEGDTAPNDDVVSGPAYKNIVVSIIGMPNVGKSSIINSLCRNTNKVKTGNEAGVTRGLSRIKLSEHIQLIDTPGVIMDGDENDAQAVLKGCVKNWPFETGEAAVDILRKMPEMKGQFIANYHISDLEFNLPDVRDLLTAIAHGRKQVKKGGEPDIESATRIVLEDWKNARLKAFAQPPTQNVAEWRIHAAPALDLEELARG